MKQLSIKNQNRPRTVHKLVGTFSKINELKGDETKDLNYTDSDKGKEKEGEMARYVRRRTWVPGYWKWVGRRRVWVKGHYTYTIVRVG